MIAALTLDEGVQLGYGLVARTAAELGVRTLAIKGPVLAAQGLREPRSSVDVDVLVDPAGFDRLRAAFEAIGWRDEGYYDTPGLVPHHSVTHRHPQWPCELDLHHWFPGFLADPAEVFDVLWQRRTTVELAHVAVPTSDVAGNAAVAALHYLRDQAHDVYADKLDDLVAVVGGWSRDDLLDLAVLAADTGAADSLRPFLDRVGAPVVAATRRLTIPLADWEMRTHAESPEVLRYLVGMHRLPWYRRPAFVWHSVWDGEHVRAELAALPPEQRSRAAARWHRVRRALRALPAAWAEYRRTRPGRR